jgi:hypothetical protein
MPESLLTGNLADKDNGTNAMIDANVDTAKLAEMFEQLGYTVEENDESGLRIRTGGVHVTVVVYEDGSLSLVCSVAGGEGVELSLEDVNDANNRVRFAKFSVVDETLLLEADFVFSLNSPNAFHHLKHIMRLWYFALQELRNLVRELVT